MTDHLPECPAAAECRCEPDQYGHYPTCPKVYCVCKFHRKGYSAGLDAAREAVAALQMGVLTTGTLLLKREDALAAIDALKETNVNA